MRKHPQPILLRSFRQRYTDWVTNMEEKNTSKQKEGRERFVEFFFVLLTIFLGSLIAGAVINWSAPDTADVDRPDAPVCKERKYPGQTCIGEAASLCPVDLEIARIAWKYFENNYNKKTGLVNSADRYPSTTMWDTGSALAATVSAYELGLIDEKSFDERVVSLMSTLSEIKLFNDEAPNKAYNTMTGEMVDYNNKPSPDGIGVSTLDLARLVSWLQALSSLHPSYDQ